MGAWHPLFSLSCRHEFFSGDTCTALDFLPTSACQRLMSNSGVILRKAAGEITAYADVNRLNSLPEVAHFDFRAQSYDRTFLNYTDGTFLQAGKFLYLCNADRDVYADGRLSKESYVSNADLYPQERIPPEFQNDGPPPLLLIRIVVDVRTPMGRTYHIPLRTRRTNWHYYISGSAFLGTDLYVADAKSEEAFDYRGDIVLPNGLSAIHFRSKTPLPLLHDQSFRFSLRERYNGRTVVKWLPTPSPRIIGRENSDEEEAMASQIFVIL
jgi:hypothetical protein